MLLKIVSYWISLPFFFPAPSVKHYNFSFHRMASMPFLFMRVSQRLLCNILQQYIWAGIDWTDCASQRNWRCLSLLSTDLIAAMLFYMIFNFEANGLLCWDTRLHCKMATDSWETQLCPPSHGPVSSLRQAIISLPPSDLMSQVATPIGTMVYGASLTCESSRPR